MPNLSGWNKYEVAIVLLQETRVAKGAAVVSEYARSLGYRVIEIPVEKRYDCLAIQKYAEVLSKEKPSLVHAHGPKATLHALKALKRSGLRTSTKIATTHHGVRASDLQLKLKIFEIVYETAVIPNCDRCFTVCTSDAEVLSSRGIESPLLRVHLNGTDRELLDASKRPGVRAEVRSEWSKEFGFDVSGDFIVGVAARLAVEKQYDVILQSVQRLLTEAPDIPIRLLCFGSGPLEAKLKTVSASLGDRVKWMGWRTGIPRQLAGLDVLLSLSLAEGLPINLIEAGWSGTPVVATAVDGVKDLVVDDYTGILIRPPAHPFEVARDLRRIARSLELASKYSNAFQERVQNQFSRAAWCARLEELYKELIP